MCQLLYTLRIRYQHGVVWLYLGCLFYERVDHKADTVRIQLNSYTRSAVGNVCYSSLLNILKETTVDGKHLTEITTAARPASCHQSSSPC